MINRLRKHIKDTILPLVCLLMIACHEKEQPTVPKLVGIEVISTDHPEFATSVNRNSDQIFFNRTTPDRSKMWIMVSQLENNEWSIPDTLPFSSGLYRDVDPFLANDDATLFFSSNRPTSNDTDDPGEFNTWYVKKVGDGWSDPVMAPAPLNSDSTEIFISIASSGNAYFVSERGGRRGIVRSKLVDGEYQDVEIIDLKLRGEVVYASNPCIASDESFLIVACRDPEGNGRPDLFVSWNQDGQWSEMQNLGESVNSPYAEFAPGLNKDNQVLYFSSERPGLLPEQAEGVRPPGDIYKVDIQAVFEQLGMR